jgi:hypothetical protein
MEPYNFSLSLRAMPGVTHSLPPRAHGKARSDGGHIGGRSHQSPLVILVRPCVWRSSCETRDSLERRRLEMAWSVRNLHPKRTFGSLGRVSFWDRPFVSTFATDLPIQYLFSEWLLDQGDIKQAIDITLYQCCYARDAINQYLHGRGEVAVAEQQKQSSGCK